MRFFMKHFISMLLVLFLLCGCMAAADPEASTETIPETTAPAATVPPQTIPLETTPPDPIRERMNKMSLEERVGQLFLARCDDSVALEHIKMYHLGGFVLFGQDFRDQTKESMIQKLAAYQQAAKVPLLIAVDEEGGTVTRVSSEGNFRNQKFSAPRQLYNGGGMDWVLAEENEKCDLLTSLGINVNLGPVCDIATQRNAFMYHRSLGQDAAVTSDFVTQVVSAMDTFRLGSCLKHFPGYGNNADTHTGIAIDSRTMEDLLSNDLLPFQAGIRAGCDAILVSHTIVEAMDPSLPASLSPAVHQYLREDMNFQGVIVTDDLVMQAVTDAYGAGEAAVLAILAGNDLLCSTEYMLQYEAVLAAVLDGRIDIDTLNNAVRNILEWKTDLGLI